MNFDSGWEYSYWLSAVVTARAAWDPLMAHADDNDALLAMLLPICKVFGADAGPRLARLLVKTVLAERELLVHGRVDGQAPTDVVKRNGMAYLEG